MFGKDRLKSGFLGAIRAAIRTGGERPGQELIERLAPAALPKRWTDREEALRAAADHLGFIRLGKRIREDIEAVFRRLERKGVLKKDGAKLRIA